MALKVSLKSVLTIEGSRPTSPSSESRKLSLHLRSPPLSPGNWKGTHTTSLPPTQTSGRRTHPKTQDVANTSKKNVARRSGDRHSNESGSLHIGQTSSLQDTHTVSNSPRPRLGFPPCEWRPSKRKVLILMKSKS